VLIFINSRMFGMGFLYLGLTHSEMLKFAPVRVVLSAVLGVFVCFLFVFCVEKREN